MVCLQLSCFLAVCDMVARGQLFLLLHFIQVVGLRSLDCGRAGFWGTPGFFEH